MFEWILQRKADAFPEFGNELFKQIKSLKQLIHFEILIQEEGEV